jgi:hypothetical protein
MSLSAIGGIGVSWPTVRLTELEPKPSTGENLSVFSDRRRSDQGWSGLKSALAGQVGTEWIVGIFLLRRAVA